MRRMQRALGPEFQKPAVQALIACFTGLALGIGVLSTTTFSLLASHLEETFGWGRGDMSIGLAIGSLVGAVLAPVIGLLIDRFGVRKVALAATIGFGAAMASMSLLTQSIVHFYIMYAVLGVTGIATTTLTYSRVIIAWFDQRRGLALGLALSGSGVGLSLIPVVLQQVVAQFGWRSAYLAVGLLILLVALPLLVLWLREPVRSRASPRQADNGKAGMGFGKAVRSAPFALLLVSFFLAGLFNTGVLAHLIPVLIDQGVRPSAAAAAMAVIGPSLICGRLMTGYLLDHIFGPTLALIMLVAPALGLAALAGGANPTLAILAIIPIGIGMGSEVDTLSYLISRYFGLRSFGRIYGVIFAVMHGGMIIGPIMMGYSKQLSGSYAIGLWTLAGACIVATIPLFFLGKYPSVVRSEDDLVTSLS